MSANLRSRENAANFAETALRRRRIAVSCSGRSMDPATVSDPAKEDPAKVYWIKGEFMLLKETTTYLEMNHRSELVPAKTPPVEIEVKQAEIACPELNRFFYTAIGGDWYWIDRLSWTYEQWMDSITRPGHETWVAYLKGNPVGYFELDGEWGGDIELAYFGILSQFTGQGIGGYLLTVAINLAWEKAPKRLWVHTSSFDHPQALRNYQARGFRVVKTETSPKDVPHKTPGPWFGANRPTSLWPPSPHSPN